MSFGMFGNFQTGRQGGRADKQKRKQSISNRRTDAKNKTPARPRRGQRFQDGRSQLGFGEFSAECSLGFPPEHPKIRSNLSRSRGCHRWKSTPLVNGKGELSYGKSLAVQNWTITKKMARDWVSRQEWMRPSSSREENRRGLWGHNTG